jgi:hypothetical protein
MPVLSSSALKMCVLFVLVSITAVSAQGMTFTKASLKGGYSVLINRWTANSSEDEVALLGIMTFDGAGNVSLSYTAMVGGVQQTGSASGTYFLGGSEGTGQIMFTTGANPPQYAIAVTSHAAGLAKSISLLRFDSNYPADATESGTAVLQSTAAVTYNVSKLKGFLNFEVDDRTFSGNTTGMLGTFNVDGKGNVKGGLSLIATRDNGGEYISAAGPYTVNSDGSGTMTLQTSIHTELTFTFVLNDVTQTGPAKGMQLLQTNSVGNQTFSGMALKP